MQYQVVPGTWIRKQGVYRWRGLFWCLSSTILPARNMTDLERNRKVASVMVVWYVKVVSVMVHVVVVVCDGSGPGKCVPKCSLCW